MQMQSHLQGQVQGQAHSQQQQGGPQQQGGAQPQQLQPQNLQGMPPIGGAQGGAPASNGVPASSAPAASSAQLQSLQSPVRSAPHEWFPPQQILMTRIVSVKLVVAGPSSRRLRSFLSFSQQSFFDGTSFKVQHCYSFTGSRAADTAGGGEVLRW